MKTIYLVNNINSEVKEGYSNSIVCHSDEQLIKFCETLTECSMFGVTFSSISELLNKINSSIPRLVIEVKTYDTVDEYLGDMVLLEEISNVICPETKTLIFEGCDVYWIGGTYYSEFVDNVNEIIERDSNGLFKSMEEGYSDGDTSNEFSYYTTYPEDVLTDIKSEGFYIDRHGVKHIL